jgi:hypothetical protein
MKIWVFWKFMTDQEAMTMLNYHPPNMPHDNRSKRNFAAEMLVKEENHSQTLCIAFTHLWSPS